MPHTFYKEFPIQFPIDRYKSLLGLGERGLMTPTYLSNLIMSVILPARIMVEKKNPLANNEQGLCTISSLYERAGLQDYMIEDFQNEYYAGLAKTHTFTSLTVDGLETLEAKCKQTNLIQQYEVFCCGNAQDAMHFATAYNRIRSGPSKNYVFWNYPGVGFSKGSADSTSDLFEAAYRQAKRLIDQGIPAGNITLRGLSLGGGVASQAARLLHEEGHLVNLEIERSFSKLAAVVPEMLIQSLTDKCTLNQSSYSPLISSTIALALLGVSLGTTFSGLVSTLGLLAASAPEAIGYIGAHCIQAIGFVLRALILLIGKIIAYVFSPIFTSTSATIQSLFEKIAYYMAYPFALTAHTINTIFSTIASFIDTAVNLIGSFLGGIIALGGLVAGSLTGLILGAFLSIPLLWTNKAPTLPMTPAFRAVLNSSCCEMNSVKAIHHLLIANNKPEHASKEQADITVINVLDDEIIAVPASLNIGLGLKPGKQGAEKNPPLKEKITSFWYRHGGHADTLRDIVDPSQTFSL